MTVHLSVHGSPKPPLPGMVVMVLWGFRCERCDHEWLPRVHKPPKVCPKCKSPYWDRPRRQRAA